MDELSPREISAEVTTIVCVSGSCNSSNRKNAIESLKQQLNLFIIPSIRIAKPLQRCKEEKSKLKEKVASSSHAWRKAKGELTRKVQVKKSQNISAKLQPRKLRKNSPPNFLLFTCVFRLGPDRPVGPVGPGTGQASGPS